MESVNLFAGISDDERQLMMACFKSESSVFGPGDVVCDFNKSLGMIGVLESGRAFTSREDENGNRTILEFLPAGSVFGETVAFAPDGDNVAVVAKTSVEATFIEYNHITKRCAKACPYHSRLVENLLRLISLKAMSLSRRIEILSRRSIREKLLAYFRLLTQKSGGSAKLPCSVATLAQYLCADRSALSRELKKLKDEGSVVLENGILRIR